VSRILKMGEALLGKEKPKQDQEIEVQKDLTDSHQRETFRKQLESSGGLSDEIKKRSFELLEQNYTVGGVLRELISGKKGRHFSMSGLSKKSSMSPRRSTIKRQFDFKIKKQPTITPRDSDAPMSAPKIPLHNVREVLHGDSPKKIGEEGIEEELK